MKKKQILILAIAIIVCAGILYLGYRAYRIQYLNSRIETFMAEQIIQIQNDGSKDRNLPEIYFIYRNEYWQLPVGKSILHGYYNSYWVSRRSQQQQLTESDWYSEYRNYLDKTIGWMYFVRPKSGALVCVFLEGHEPRSWTTNGSVSGYTTWIVDTSKNDWELERADSSQCITRLADFMLSTVP
jgi:hypothetical protein